MTNSMKPQKRNEPDWVMVYTTPDPREAHIVAGRLTSEGIRPYIHSQPGASAMGITLGTLGAVSVLVRPSDYDVAMDLLFPPELDQLPNTTDDYTILDGDDDFDDDKPDPDRN